MERLRITMTRGRIRAAAWGASLLSGTVLTLGMTGTLSGFTASIDNNGNSAGTGSVLMTETDGTTTCYSNGATASTTVTTNSNTCAINKLGGLLTMAPGGTATKTITITNSGSLPVATAFTLTPGGCTASGNGTPNGTDTSGFCGKVDVSIWDSTDGKCVVPVSAGTVQANCTPSSSTSLTALSTTAIDVKAITGSLAAGAAKSFTFTTLIDATAANSDMDLQVSDNLSWAFTE